MTTQTPTEALAEALECGARFYAGRNTIAALLAALRARGYTVAPVGANAGAGEGAGRAEGAAEVSQDPGTVEQRSNGIGDVLGNSEELRAVLLNIVQVYDMAAEMFTSDADLAGSMADRARAALAIPTTPASGQGMAITATPSALAAVEALRAAGWTVVAPGDGKRAVKPFQADCANMRCHVAGVCRQQDTPCARLSEMQFQRLPENGARPQEFAP